MRRLFLSICLFVGLFSMSYSQGYSRQYGEVSSEELDLKTYSGDPQAEAVIIFDIGDARFFEAQGGFDIEFTRSKRIKILSREGIKYAEVEIPFYTDETGRAETISTLNAVSYNVENGKLVKTPLDPSTVYEETVNSRWKTKKFVFPNVKQGSIIEYKYVLVTPFQFNLPDWEFQSRIPNLYSRYTVRMIPFYEYIFLLQGKNKFDYQTSTKDSKVRTFGQVTEIYGQNTGNGVKFQDLIHVYGMNNVPAFRDESYITSVADNIMKIDFQLARIISPYAPPMDIMTTWPKLIKDILQNDNFGKFLNACSRQASKIIQTGVPASAKSEVEKCRSIVNYVKSAYKWDEYYSIYSSKSAKDFISQKKGNSADINLFLTSLLNEAGLEAYPVLISTRDHGRIRSDYPFLHFFNSVIVIVNVNGKSVLCDATEYFTQYDMIPPGCINEKGLIIKNGQENWVMLNLGYTSIDEKSVMMDIYPEKLKSSNSVTLQSLGYDAYYYKKTFENDTLKLKDYFSESGFMSANKISTFNFEQTERPYIVRCVGESDLEQLDNKIIISPFLRFYPGVNKLTQPDRTYPIDFTYGNTESYICKVTVPEGYKVLSLPEEFTLDNELVKISVKYLTEDKLIRVECSYGFKKAVYPASDFKSIKSYFDIIVKKFNEKIVLVAA